MQNINKILFSGLLLFLTNQALAVLPASVQGTLGKRISGNSVVQIINDGTAIWIGTNSGISRTTDGGVSWEFFKRAEGLNSNELSALGFVSGRVLAATAHTGVVSEVEIPTGDGFNYTTDGGANWPSSKPFQASSPGMLVYDIASHDSAFWAGAFFGGLIRSFDGGVNWENVFVDTFAQNDFLDSSFLDYRNRYFAVLSDTSRTDTTIIWAGTAAGIQEIIYTDTTEFDTLFYYQNIDPDTCIFQKSHLCDSTDVAIGWHIESDTFICGSQQVIKIDSIPCAFVDSSVTDIDSIIILPQITGNFVAAMGINYSVSPPAVWGAARPTFSGVTAVNFTRDEGQTWDTTLSGEFVWDFAFRDTVVWAATSSGLKRSENWGQSWTTFTGMVDAYDSCNCQIINPEFYAVLVSKDTVWAGGADGLAMTTDNGLTWTVYRAFVPIGTAGTPGAYAYPTPFSPRLSGGATRIHYKPSQGGDITIKIYDFAMNLVMTVIEKQNRPGGTDCEEPWDGKDQDGDEVANGVYFFKVEMPGETQWGKVVILK